MIYEIRLRAPDIAPEPTATPTLTLPASPVGGPTITATVSDAPSGAALAIYDGALVVWSGVAAPDGTATAEIPLEVGEHSLSATARAAGRATSARSLAQDLVVLAPTAAPALVLPSSPTALPNPITITLLGAPAGAILRVYDGAAVVATAPSTGTGVDVFAVAIAEGAHQISASAQAGGAPESSHVAQPLVVDRTAPIVALVVDTPSPSLEVQLDVSAPGAVAYVVSQDPTPPAADDPRWGAAPASLLMASVGGATPAPSVTLPTIASGSAFVLAGHVPQVPWTIHAWARDAAGNVGHAQADVVIAIPLTEAPVMGEVPAIAAGDGGWLTGSVPQSPGDVVSPDGRYVIIETQGATFEPLLAVDDGAQVEWLWGDGTTGAGVAPSKSFLGAGPRLNRLRVTPWHALKMIDLGYDAGDGGDAEIPLHPPQGVTAIRGLQVATGLELLAFSGNPVATLDISGMPNIRKVESFLNHSMKFIDASDCPNLRRLCLEENECEGVLDLTASGLLEDLRGSVNRWTGILFAPAVPNLWHVCVQAVPGLAQLPYERFTGVIQLWIDRSGQTGILPIVNPGMLSVLIWECGFTGVDLSLVSTGGALHQFNAADCGWDQAAVDSVLAELVRINAQYGQRECILTGNAAPSAAGQASADTLRSRGWTVLTA